MLLSISRETTNFEHIESIINKGMPIVFYDRMYNNPLCSKVVVDDYSGAKEAVLHLVEQGCRKIAHLIASPNLIISAERLRGYQDALKESNIELKPEWVAHCKAGTFEEGKRVTYELISMHNRPDAIFATNDPLAMGSVMAIKERGLRIPKDIAIVGFSNWFFGELLEPSLTTVDQPGFEMGQEAARILLKHIEMKEKNLEPEHEMKVLKTKLVIRNSSLRKR